MESRLPYHRSAAGPPAGSRLRAGDPASPFGHAPGHAPGDAPGHAPYGQSQRKDAKASLREALQILRRKKWTILLVTLVVTGLAGAYIALAAPEYEAYTLLMVEQGRPSSSANTVEDGAVPGALQREPRNMTDQLLLLQQSLPIARRVAQRLREAQDQFSGPITALAAGGDGESPSTTQVAQRLQENYVSATRENELEGSSLRITATSSNPREAAFIANAYAEAYLQYARGTSRSYIDSSRAFLERQITAHRADLRRLEDEIQTYMSETGATALDEEVKRTVEQIATLEARLDAARVEERRSQAALRSVQQELEQIRPELARRVSSGVDAKISRAQQRIAELEARREQIYIKNPALRSNPSQSEDVTALNDEVAELKSRVDRLSEEYISEMMAVGGTDPLKSESGSSMTYLTQLKRRAAEERVAISGAEARGEALSQRLGQYEHRMRTIPEQSAHLAQLRREQRSTEALYLNLVKKLQEVRLADEATMAVAHIVRPALIPESPMLPRRLFLIAGVLLGLALGVIGAVLQYKLDSRIYTPEDLYQRDFATVGVIPDMHRLNGGGGHSANGEEEVSTALGAPKRGSSAVVESYRRLHMSVRFSRPGKVVQTVLVTSPEPGAGKSTTVFNMALAAARSGQRTLVVEADLRKPRIYRFLDRTSGPFLTDLLDEPSVPTRGLATDFENLYAITIREPLADADVVLSSSKMARLVERLREVFDLIIFDSPPVLAVADALSLSSQCDATIVVASAGQTRAEALEQTTEELRNADADVVGTVLNRFNPSASSSYASKYRYQDYGDYSTAA